MDEDLLLANKEVNAKQLEEVEKEIIHERRIEYVNGKGERCRMARRQR